MITDGLTFNTYSFAFKVFKNKHYNHKYHVYVCICVCFLTIWKVWPVRLDSEAMC